MSTFHRNGVLNPSENSASEQNLLFLKKCDPSGHFFLSRLTGNSVFQSQGATETSLRGRRRATRWAKLWLL